MNKPLKIALIVSMAVIGTVCLVGGIPTMLLGVRSHAMNVDWRKLKTDETYSKKAEVANMTLVEQRVSCGYACIEMLSTYYGKKITEEELSAKHNGEIVTATTDGFINEINDVVRDHLFLYYSYLKNDEFLKEIHDSLSKGNPVAIEWAAPYDGQWTLHFSVISSLDLANDDVVVYNPYGYVEKMDVNTLLRRTSFAAYENMPAYYGFAFAFGMFDKNIVIHC